jgi:hypothetical protein
VYGSVSTYQMLEAQEHSGSDAEYLGTNDFQTTQIAVLCKQLGFSRCVNVALRPERLDAYLQRQEIASRSIDLTAILRQCATGAIDRNVASPFKEEPNYLTTCVNLLQSVDREHLSLILEFLHQLTDKFIIIGVRTSPSPGENLFGSTILSRSTWQRLIEQSGFTLIKMLDPPPNNEALASGLSRHWQNSGLGNISDAVDERMMLFEKTSEKTSEKTFEKTDDYPSTNVRDADLLDISYRKIKREQISFSDQRKIFFNFNVPQEWSFFRPILDVLPREKTHFLLRYNPLSDELYAAAVRGFLKRNGIPFTVYEEINDLPWAEIRGNVVLTASESTMDQFHLLSHEVTAMARVHKCATILLQHGIWPGAAANRIVTFASEKVLCWSKDEADRLQNGIHDVYGESVPWGIISEKQLCLVGSPKYSDQLMPTKSSLAARLGFEETRFKKKVLFGTKNLRGRFGVENINSEFLKSIKTQCGNNQDVLFVLRPHPLTKQEEFAEVKAPNVVIFDELTGILGDTQLCRVIPQLDLVCTSPSTLILDGAVSNKPVFVYGTGQPIIYRSIETASVDELTEVMHDDKKLASLRLVGQEFKSNYGEAIDDIFYSHLSEILKQPPEMNFELSTAASVSFAEELRARKKVAEMQAAEVVELRARLAKARAQSSLQKEFIRDLRRTRIDSDGGEGQSEEFDESWYLSRYPDVQASGMTAISHYEKIGKAEKRKANRQQELAFKNFDPNFYLALYPDIAKSGIDPFLHYVLHGEAEGRLPCNLNLAYPSELL